MNAASNDNLLFDREITCPICEQTFKEKAVRSSKLRLDSVDPDSRQNLSDLNRSGTWFGFVPIVITPILILNLSNCPVWIKGTPGTGQKPEI